MTPMPSPFRLSDPVQTATDLDGALPAGGGLVLFEGVPESDAVAAADALASRRGLRLHHVHARDLLAERFDAMQGNVREVLDEARGGSVFLLTGAEELLNARPERGDDEPEEPPPAERLRRYLLDRIGAFEGVVVLSAAGPAEGLGALHTGAVVVSA